MTFYTGRQFPQEYGNDAFACEHGSWNRSRRTGYKVIRVPLHGGVPTGEYEDFLTGFVTPDGNVWGRPVGVTVAKDGSLLVTDDAAARRPQHTGRGQDARGRPCGPTSLRCSRRAGVCDPTASRTTVRPAAERRGKRKDEISLPTQPSPSQRPASPSRPKARKPRPLRTAWSLPSSACRPRA